MNAPSGRQPSAISRRRLLEIGGGSLLGLGLADLLRARASAGEGIRSDRSVIFIYLHGGLSQYESYDPKPDAIDVYRGPHSTIATNVPGLQFSSMLPEQAKIADKLVVLRSLAHRDGNHPAAVHLWKTGHVGAQEPDRHQLHPSVAAVVAKALGNRNRELPASVVTPHSNHTTYDGPNYLGPEAQPLAVDLNHQLLAVTDSFRLTRGVTAATFDNRRRLLERLDQLKPVADYENQMHAVDTFNRKAVDMLLGDQARNALDLTQETERTRDDYGRNHFGQGVLLARRVVEAGVPFVTVNSGGNIFDHHERIVELLNRDLPSADKAVAALVTDLHRRGLQDKVLVVLATDFGRDRMNNIAGRHHWPDCGVGMLACGGLRGGRAIGASDRDGKLPRDTPLQPADVLATVYHHLGIPLDAAYPDFTGRPISIVEGGRLIPQLSV